MALHHMHTTIYTWTAAVQCRHPYTRCLDFWHAYKCLCITKDVAIHKSNYTATIFHVAINKRQLYRFPISVTKVKLARPQFHAAFSVVVFFPWTPLVYLPFFPPPCPASLLLSAVVTFFLFTLAPPALVATVITTGLAVGWLDWMKVESGKGPDC